MGDKTKITMTELARRANVDVSTVSRALNDSPLVKPRTKDLILKLAAETGYAINASARNLRRQSSEAIGLVIPLNPDSRQTISDPFFLEMIGAVSRASSERGYDLVISIPQTEEQITEKRLLQTARADGLIIIGQAGRTERLTALGPLADFVVLWGGWTGQPNGTLVGSDNVEGGRQAVEHLLNLGRRSILFLGDTGLPEVKLRYDGLKMAHAARSHEHATDLVLPLAFGGAATYDAVCGVIDKGRRFDAIFAASDVLAMAAIHALQARGLSTPQDVAVVGYDNIGQAALMTPALTTIDQNIQLGGALMVDLLLRKIRGEDVQPALTPTNLIVRASCGSRAT
ncbi:MAG: LacI family DNA-binding transcriptional regulator [Pseudomonadota bacterium]